MKEQQITKEDYYWLNDDSRTFLGRDYLSKGVTPEDRIQSMADSAEKILGKEVFRAKKFVGYMKKGFYSLSSPIWSNFGTEKGLPISCNGSYIPDTMEDILAKSAEIGTMTKHGAGTSAYFGDVRPRGTPVSDWGSASGPTHYMSLYDCVTDVVSQSSVRRGSMAAYLPVEHPDIKEFLMIRSEGHPIQAMSIGVTITDGWMKEMVDGDIEKRDVWKRIVKKRCETGYPYIFFTDTVNNNAPQVYKDKGNKIYASNLCSEICLPSSEKESFVCNLSSMNITEFEEWKDTDAVETMIFFLDAVMSEYIRKTKEIKFLECAYNFAKNHRALGLGTLGWHTYLQSKSIPFESFDAKLLNTKIHKTIAKRALSASKTLAKLFGEPDMLKGYGVRNTTLMSIAPTTSSSFILGQVSPSIEPLNSNYFVKDLAKGKFTFKNPELKKVLAKHGRDDSSTWRSILIKGGSVQHLSFLSDREREVFKTFGEISQREVIIQAAARQISIDQSQSLNLMIPPDATGKEVSDLLIFAWKSKVKTLYYQRSGNPAQELSRSIMNCASCEG